jgi:hypothetical protein
VAVLAHHEVPLELALDQPFLRAKVVSSVDERFHVRQRVLIEGNGNVPVGQTQATLVITSPSYPAHRLEVPINVHCRGWLRLSPAQVFFGFVKEGETRSEKVLVRSVRPVEVRGVETNAASVSARVEPGTDGRSYILTVQITPPREGVMEGKIILHTDMEGEEPTEVEYYAHVLSGT